MKRMFKIGNSIAYRLIPFAGLENLIMPVEIILSKALEVQFHDMDLFCSLKRCFINLYDMDSFLVYRGLSHVKYFKRIAMTPIHINL